MSDRSQWSPGFVDPDKTTLSHTDTQPITRALAAAEHRGYERGRAAVAARFQKALSESGSE